MIKEKFQTSLKLVSIQHISDSVLLLELAAEMELPCIKAGQFVQIQVPDSARVLLRRPISINDVNPDNGHVTLLVQMVGRGTQSLSQLKPGDALDVLLPLGNGFDTSQVFRNALLVGGGVGVAPLFLLGRQLKEAGRSFSYLLGARTESQLLRLNEFRELAEVNVATQDGSLGEKGLVTEHSILCEDNFDIIFCCGPTPMMKAVAAYAASRGIPCQVSLEHSMACGIGACLCCVEDTVNGNVCICKEGPVFDTRKLKWQN